MIILLFFLGGCAPKPSLQPLRIDAGYRNGGWSSAEDISAGLQQGQQAIDVLGKRVSYRNTSLGVYADANAGRKSQLTLRQVLLAGTTMSVNSTGNVELRAKNLGLSLRTGAVPGGRLWMSY
jgi:hypothetical protein